MKILSLVTNRYSPFYVQQSAVLECQGVSVEHIFPRQQNSERDAPTEIKRSYRDYLSMLPKVLKNSFSDYDLVHANNGKTIPFAVCQPHRPIVLTLWGSDLMNNYPRLSRWGAKYSDEVIVRSEEMASILDCDAHVIPSGVDMELFRPIDQSHARNQLGWNETANYVLFPYDPSRTVKNYPLAKRVVQQVNEHLDTSATLQTVADADHEEMPLYMNAADVLLLTSTREGSPNTVKEAMACNLPVISTDVGDVAERLSGVKYSHVCATEDDLVERLTDVLKAGERSDGREHVQELSLERMGERIIEVYERAMR